MLLVRLAQIVILLTSIASIESVKSPFIGGTSRTVSNQCRSDFEGRINPMNKQDDREEDSVRASSQESAENAFGNHQVREDEGWLKFLSRPFPQWLCNENGILKLAYVAMFAISLSKYATYRILCCPPAVSAKRG